MHLTGATPDGRPVIAGVFPLVGTHSVPLEIVLDFFQRRGFVMDWLDYIAGARKDGHKPRTIKARITAAVGDVFGREHAQAVGERIDRCLPDHPTLR
jgi:hypothetical protein